MLKHKVAHALNSKLTVLSDLLQADGAIFGRLESQPGYFLDIEGIRVGAEAVENGGQGKYYAEFATTRSLHAYLNDKIKLFKGEI